GIRDKLVTGVQTCALPISSIPADHTGARDAIPGDIKSDAPPPTACDLLTQDPCTADQACVLETSGLVCDQAGSLTAGQSCGHAQGGGCARGLVCVVPPQGGDATCAAVCDPSAAPSTQCPGGGDCSGVVPGV